MVDGRVMKKKTHLTHLNKLTTFEIISENKIEQNLSKHIQQT